MPVILEADTSLISRDRCAGCIQDSYLCRDHRTGDRYAGRQGRGIHLAARLWGIAWRLATPMHADRT
jgi:hypothetical protein